VPTAFKKAKYRKEKAEKLKNFLTPNASKKAKFVKFGVNKAKLATLRSNLMLRCAVSVEGVRCSTIPSVGYKPLSDWSMLNALLLGCGKLFANVHTFSGAAPSVFPLDLVFFHFI